MKRGIEINANGKILLTGEYLVLVGAKAMALPVRYGQKMMFQEIPRRVIEWESLSPGGPWFFATFDPGTLKILETDKKNIAQALKKLLTGARRLNPAFLAGENGWKVKVTSNYPLEWGLGSSATLCYLVAGWAGVPEFDLNQLISKGSGYDIACAGRQGLIFYQLRKGKPEITPVEAGLALQENTYFAYLGRKQDSNREVAAFLVNSNYSEIDLVEVSRLTSDICTTDSPEELIRLVNEHEFIISTILKKEPVSRRFPTFPGTVKSLGAWGGDFAMFVSSMEPEVVMKSLYRMGFHKVFRYSDLEIKA